MTVIKVSSLHYYPVKSCRGISLKEAVIGPKGIENDRRFMLTGTDGEFMTQRNHPRMALIHPNISDSRLHLSAPRMPDIYVTPTYRGDRIDVNIWKDRCVAVDQGEEAAQWLSEFLGTPCRLVQMADDFNRDVDPDYTDDRSAHVDFVDGFPFLLISEASVNDLNRRLDSPVPVIRFRPNIVVSGSLPYAEDHWKKIRIGSIEFSSVKPCARCVITTIDPDTARKSKEPMRTLATYRLEGKNKVLFGHNLIHNQTGRIKTGDEVVILD
ncbi:MAG: MOSC domain-containing protein [Calditrichaceae bacterium]